MVVAVVVTVLDFINLLSSSRRQINFSHPRFLHTQIPAHQINLLMGFLGKASKKTFFGRSFPNVGGCGGWFPNKVQTPLSFSQISQKPRGGWVGKHIWERSPKKKLFLDAFPYLDCTIFVHIFHLFEGDNKCPEFSGSWVWHHGKAGTSLITWPMTISTIISSDPCQFVTKYFWSKKSQICASFTIGSFLIWESGCNQSLAGLSHLSKPYDCIHHHQRVIITITIAQKVPISIL